MSLKRNAVVILILAVIGLGIAAWLTYVHVRIHTDPTYVSLCAFNDTFNCETVAASRYSVFAGLPVSIIGAFFYLMLVLLSLEEIVGRENGGSTGWMVLLGLGGVAASLVLGGLSVWAIDAVCVLCFAVYAVNVALAVVTIARSRAMGGVGASIVAQFAGIKRRYWPLVYFGLYGALLLVAGPGRGIPRYWETAAWHRDMELLHGVEKSGIAWIGAKESPLTVHEYFDSDCPACRLSHKKLRQVISRYPNRIRLVRHDAPRTRCITPKEKSSLMPCRAARSAFCAGVVGRYWEWNDAVISSPKTRSDYRHNHYEMGLATQLGFNGGAFRRCMYSESTTTAVQRLKEEAKEAGIRHTPTYMVDGKKMDLKTLVELIDERLD